MSDINFIKKPTYKSKTKLNKYFIGSGFILFIFFISINLYQISKIYKSKKLLEQLHTEVADLDLVAKENNEIKLEIKKAENKIELFESILKSNNNLFNFLINVSKLLPNDSYLQNLSFEQNEKISDKTKEFNETKKNKEKINYDLKLINLKGFGTSQSIIEFIEKLSRLEIVDNVRLDYLKYKENQDTNLLEFSIKLLLNNV